MSFLEIFMSRVRCLDAVFGRLDNPKLIRRICHFILQNKMANLEFLEQVKDKEIGPDEAQRLYSKENKRKKQMKN